MSGTRMVPLFLLAAPGLSRLSIACGQPLWSRVLCVVRACRCVCVCVVCSVHHDDLTRGFLFFCGQYRLPGRVLNRGRRSALREVFHCLRVGAARALRRVLLFLVLAVDQQHIDARQSSRAGGFRLPNARAGWHICGGVRGGRLRGACGGDLVHVVDVGVARDAGQDVRTVFLHTTGTRA